jgi:hypothetical protein
VAKLQWKQGISLAVASLAAGCGEGGELVRMPAQGTAFQVVRAALEEALPLPGRPMVEPEVRWWTETCPGTDTSAVVFGPRCYAGLYYRRAGVDVAWRGSIGTSAYTHELMHYFLDAAGLGSDAAHAQKAYWELVERIDLRLQEEGL